MFQDTALLTKDRLHLVTGTISGEYLVELDQTVSDYVAVVNVSPGLSLETVKTIDRIPLNDVDQPITARNIRTGVPNYAHSRNPFPFGHAIVAMASDSEPMRFGFDYHELGYRMYASISISRAIGESISPDTPETYKILGQPVLAETVEHLEKCLGLLGATNVETKAKYL